MSLGRLISSWDAEHLLALATSGYDRAVVLRVDGTPEKSNLNFYPAYPVLVRWLANVPGLNEFRSALLVTFVAGAIAAWGVCELGARLSGDRRIGVVMALLWGVAPGSVVLQMAYSEALFAAFAAWALVAIVEENWLTAVPLIGAASLVRNTGFALVAAISLAALCAIIRGSAGWRPWLSVAIAPLTGLGYLGFVAARTHRIDGWVWLQDKAWGLRFDGGEGTVADVWHYLGHDGNVYYTLCSVSVIVSALLFFWSLGVRLPLSLHLYTACVLVAAVGTDGFFNSKPRLILLAFHRGLPAGPSCCMYAHPRTHDMCACACRLLRMVRHLCHDHHRREPIA
ncbi:hypothetical protein [Nocardia brasiliensis]|uniref:hypothetical protein n=1 Tax=Nocardia brasiliensis TaxID=37326 RepID=UPI002457A2EC|nr:hypothetical protein [Nocardia brasiliensis]